MSKLFLSLAYVGTGFSGYQVQPGKRTVQAELNRAAFEIYGSPCDVTGCSRTDAGVHAEKFCCCISFADRDFIDEKLAPDRAPLAFNAHLPADIRVFDARYVPGDFHPRYDVVKKEYRYRFYCSPCFSPFEENRAFAVPYVFGDGEVAKMKKACSYFVGKHDFSAFVAVGSSAESNERTVYAADVEKEGNVVTFTVSADGFLYNMVRIMAGTLLHVAAGKIAPESIPEVIASRDRSGAGPTLPPEGLYLHDVVYGEDKQ